MSASLLLYLDPGTGSLLLYALLGIVTTLLFLVRKVYYMIKQLFRGKTDVAMADRTFDIVIHSEGARYYNVFNPLIDEFIKNGRKIVYVTPDINDPALEIKNENFEVLSFKNEFKEISFLNNIKCNLLISTTPHLDVYMWKKSKKVRKYVHIFHSPTGVDFYERYALSFYDVIICPNKEIEMAQKYLDKKRNLPEKEYYIGGCTYLDTMVQSVKAIEAKVEDKTVLYAPSWGSRSSLNTYGIKILEQLLNQGYKVIFRPHPQSFISDKEIIDSIINQYGNSELFELDRNKSGLASMVRSEALISDFSGVVFDYYYLFKRPIFLASQNASVYGYEVEDLPEEYQFDIPLMKKVSKTIEEKDISEIVKLIEENKKGNEQNNEITLPYFGESSKRIYEIITSVGESL